MRGASGISGRLSGVPSMCDGRAGHRDPRTARSRPHEPLLGSNGFGQPEDPCPPGPGARRACLSPFPDGARSRARAPDPDGALSPAPAPQELRGEPGPFTPFPEPLSPKVRRSHPKFLEGERWRLSTRSAHGPQHPSARQGCSASSRPRTGDETGSSP